MITYPTRSKRLSDHGRTSHAEIDAQLPSREEKEALSKIATPIANFSANGLKTLIPTATVTDPPTDAELDTTFGTPATVGAGFLALLRNGAEGNLVYLVASDGTYWWRRVLTKAE